MQVHGILVCCALLLGCRPTHAAASRQEQNDRPTPQGMGLKSKMKCREFGETIYVNQSVPSLFPDDDPTVVRVRQCGAPIGQDLIVGGEQTQPDEFPHMAALGYGSSDDIAWLCGGSLISEKFILTAAHCLTTRDRGIVRWVLLGDYDLVSSSNRGDPQLFSVADRIRHPDYKYPSIYNDLALLRLDREAILGKYVRPSCLHVQHDIGGGYAVATGWGRTTQTGVGGSEVLMKVTLDLMAAESCDKAYKSKLVDRLKMGFQDRKMICAGVNEGGKDSCNGDSGAPLQTLLKDPDCMYNIVGVTSFGFMKCGSPESPAIYTRVSNYIPWIESVVWP